MGLADREVLLSVAKQTDRELPGDRVGNQRMRHGLTVELAKPTFDVSAPARGEGGIIDAVSSLLADIVASRNLQPEPVATDALVHLLSRSEAGRQAITKLFTDISGSELGAPLTFTAQVTGPDDQGRPDIVGSDTSGARLIIEAKFDAELTAIQRTQAYEGRLATGKPGVVLFLAPTDRLAALWPEILDGPGTGVAEPPAWSDNDSVVRCQLPSANLLAATSWDHLLAVLREALGVANDSAGLADLSQIDGLVAWRTRMGWTPLIADDLPVRSGRQLSGLVNATIAAASETSAAKIRNGSGDQGAGRYITTASGHTVWVGVWLSWWGRYGHSPVWAQVRAAKGTSVHLIGEQLAEIPLAIARPTEGDVVMPLLIPRGAEQESVRRSLAEQLQRIASALDALPEAVTSDEDEDEGAALGPASAEAPTTSY